MEAIVVGYKLSGILGALVAILGTVLPPFVILSVISVFYKAFRNNWLISQLLEGHACWGRSGNCIRSRWIWGFQS